MLSASEIEKKRPTEPETSQSCLPTFLGIGGMRCGSTWLAAVSKYHPEVRIADEKEMDFFFMRRMLSHDLCWYESYFRPRDGEEVRPARGEISPRYARLKGWQVRRIAECLPDLRIILTLRHPIERLWSQTLYDFGRLQRRDVRQVGGLELLRQLERPRSRLSADYFRTVKVWSDAFGWEALHIDFFDRLRNDPNGYVNDILRHIGASSPWQAPEELVKKRVWSTTSLVKAEREIPELVRWYMARQLLEPTKRLNALLDGRVSQWVDELGVISGEARTSWRILGELSRLVISVPEKLAYEGFHLGLDARLWWRWRQLQKQVSGVSDFSHRN
jgi:hypothetical protein